MIISHELVLIGVEPGTLRFRVDVITRYTTAQHFIGYMSPECSMSLGTELCIVLSSERVLYLQYIYIYFFRSNHITGRHV